ncbi:MAG: membrane dipeptidase [Bacteroidota bacterium]
MATLVKYGDIHCHPTLRPFGQTIDGIHYSEPKDKGSIWYYDPPCFTDKIFENLAGVSKYSQSNYTAAVKGNMLLIGTSLYAPEVAFFENRLGEGPIAHELENIVTGFGIKRIKEIESESYDYFEDINGQYNFLKSLDGHKVRIGKKLYSYRLISSFSELEDIEKENEQIVAVFINMEGGHGFGCGKDPKEHPADPEVVMKNLESMLAWKHKPFYITMAHHFYNELLGHTKSIPDELKNIIDQSYGMDTGITDLGYRVIRKILEPGNNVLIDVKHMSTRSREQFYHLIDTEYSNRKLPLIFSHGGVNGLPDFSYAGTHVDGSLFNEDSISLFDDEIGRIVKSNGIIGLNIDQRVMASKIARKDVKGKILCSSKYYSWSSLIWNNIRYIAEYLDRHDLPSWDNICFGTDYDGAINPVNYFWTYEEMPRFHRYLRKHISEYLRTCKLKNENRIPPDEIAKKIMGGNLREFLKNNFS